jgi:hypothetical protein
VDGISLAFLILGPAVVGVIALVVGIRVLSKPKRGTANTNAQNIFGVLCLLVALGIGACYGLMLVGNLVG